MPSPRIFLVLALICFILLAIFGNLLFAWLGPFFLLLSLVAELESGHTLKRIFISRTGLRFLLNIEILLILVAAIIFVPLILESERLHRMIESTQNLREIIELWNREDIVRYFMFLSIGLPFIVFGILSGIIKRNEKNPLVDEIKASTLWKIERVSLSILMLMFLVGGLISSGWIRFS